MSATENDWNVLSFVAQHIGAQEDGSIMREEIHLGKLALVVFVAISEFQRLPAEGATLQTYHRISDSYTRYKKKVAQINAMGSCKLLGGATFKELIKEADIVAIFEQGAHAAAQKISSLEAAVLDLLQPALHWKDGFNEETQLEEVVTAGVNTIMTVKGKKLHTQALALQEAHGILFSFPLCIPSSKAKLVRHSFFMGTYGKRRGVHKPFSGQALTKPKRSRSAPTFSSRSSFVH